MNKYCILLICLLSVLGLKAQEFQGKAEYICKQIFKNGVEEFGIKSDDNLRKNYEEALKKASEKIYMLTFNKKEAFKWFLPAQILHILYIVLIGTLSIFYKKYKWR